MTNIFKNLLTAAKGFAMGAANVIPGVSGGTIALLTGIFEELVESLNALLDVRSWKLLFKGKFREWNEYVHGTFLLWLCIGLIVSIFTLAKLMEYVLHYHPIQTWSFFFGLIIASSIYLLADVKKWKVPDVLWLILGIVFGVVICTLSPTQTSESLWFIAVCGAIAICTMILPGISGSFILVILGKYDFIMKAVSDLNWPVLITFAIGCVIGLAAFSKFLHWLLSKCERQTLLILIGFTLGSLVKVWPWSDKISLLTAQLMRGGMTPEQAQVAVDSLSSSGTDLTPLIEPQYMSALLWCLVGIALVVVLEWLSSALKKQDKAEA
jgi:putative membrane protein